MQNETTLAFLISQGYSQTILERFWKKVQKFGPVPPHCPELGMCWVWMPSKDNLQHGVIGRGSYTTAPAHRTSWLIHNGAIPDGLCVLHRCDYPPCVNPAHLFLGTKADNMYDMYAKGREVHNPKKLTEAKVIEILALKDKLSVKEIAQRFKVNRSMISRIHHNKLWIWLER